MALAGQITCMHGVIQNTCMHGVIQLNIAVYGTGTKRDVNLTGYANIVVDCRRREKYLRSQSSTATSIRTQPQVKSKI